MELKNIKIADAKRSETNPRPAADFKGPAFDELVASIKEKGVLVPVLARALTGKNKIGKWEVIAGNRRLAAAKEAGLEEIPAQIVGMTDQEAAEAQIVENLQRQDIHPLEEVEAYRKLIESSKPRYEVKDVAAKVGKSETYVRGRLFLTNLSEKAADAYRKGTLTDGQAVLVARLEPADQDGVMKQAKESPYMLQSIGRLKEWIEEHIYSPIEFQPWVGVKELEKAVGACKECEPNRMSLFGPVQEGRCTSLVCWGRKMQAYIDHAAKEKKLVKVSGEYGPAPKGVKYGKSDYTLIAKKGKDRCASVHGAIIVNGSEIGKVIDICTDKACKTHGHAEYRLSPAEEKKRKESRKKEIADAKRKKEAREKRLKESLAKVYWPLKEKHLEALLALAMDQASANTFRGIAKRHELELTKKKSSWGADFIDYQGAVKRWAEKLGKVEKARLAFELLIDTGYDTLREGIGKL